MRRTPDRRVIGAVTALAVAGLIFVYTFARAVTIEPVPPTAAPAVTTSMPVPADASPTEAKVPSEGPLTSDALRLAVDNDPFQADRRPPQPYRMPGDAIEVPPTSPPAVVEPPAPPFKLLGTVSMPGSGVALMQVEETTPLVVSVGDAVMGYTLKAVDMTGATLASRTGSEVRLAVAPPSPEGASSGRGQNGRNAGRGPRGSARGNAAAAAAAAAMLERLRNSGAPPDVIERAMQQLEQLQQGRGARGFIEIGQPDRVIFRRDINTDTLTSRPPDSPGDR